MSHKMNIAINDIPFPLQGLESLDVRLHPLNTSEILRSDDGSLLYTPEDGRMEIVLEGKGSLHPILTDVRKGAHYTLSHPLPLWTKSQTPPRLHQGPCILKNDAKGYLPIFSCILSDFEIKTEVLSLQVHFKFVFEEV